MDIAQLEVHNHPSLFIHAIHIYDVIFQEMEEFQGVNPMNLEVLPPVDLFKFKKIRSKLSLDRIYGSIQDGFPIVLPREPS